MARKERIVAPGSAGTRIDAFVARELEDVSRRYAKELARRGCVRCDGRVVRGSHVLQAGNRVEVELPGPDDHVLPEVPLLHEDASYIYLHKPPGMHTVRHRPSDPPTLADVARSLDPGCGRASADPREAGALHRLDVGTSGVVAFARTPEAWTRGRGALEGAWKLYLARPRKPPSDWPPGASPHVQRHDAAPRWPLDASIPRPEEPGIRTTWPLQGAGARGHRVRVDDGGLAAVSLLWPTSAARSVFAVELLTGRRHQVRVHMATLGIPIEGDTLYGSGSEGERLHLHAWAFQLGPGEPVVATEPPRWCLP
jgi:23S rRNA pseudouridine1911/1915/1917 synthase